MPQDPPDCSPESRFFSENETKKKENDNFCLFEIAIKSVALVKKLIVNGETKRKEHTSSYLPSSSACCRLRPLSLALLFSYDASASSDAVLSVAFLYFSFAISFSRAASTIKLNNDNERTNRICGVGVCPCSGELCL